MSRIRSQLAAVFVIAVMTLTGVLASAGSAYAAPPEPDNGSGVMGPLNPTDANGVRIDHYDVMADDGTADFGKKVLLFFTNLVFALNRWVVGLAAWLVDWALDFKIAKYLLTPVTTLVNVLESHLIDGTGLESFALVLAAVICGVWILTGRRSRGVSEIVTTLVIAAVATVYVTSPATTIFGADGLLNKTRDLSLEVAALVTSDGAADTGGSSRVSGRVRGMLVDTFVRKPHEVINYGVVFDADPAKPHRCLDVYNGIVADGPWGSEHEPRARMASCDQDLADFNANPTVDRLGAAVLALVAALFVSVLAIVIGVVLLGTQLWLVFEAIRLMFALVIGLVPGSGRAQLWKALGGLAAALASVVATIVFLALFVVLTRALLSATANESLFVRFLLLDVAIAAGLVWYRRIVAGGRAMAARLSARMGGRGTTEAPRPTKLWQDSKAELRRLHLHELRPRQIRKRAGQAKQRIDRIRQGRVARGARWLAGRLPIPRRRRPRERGSTVEQTRSREKATTAAGSPRRQRRTARRDQRSERKLRRLRRRAARVETPSPRRRIRGTSQGQSTEPAPSARRAKTTNRRLRTPRAQGQARRQPRQRATRSATRKRRL